jgi:hypothetical protein
MGDRRQSATSIDGEEKIGRLSLASEMDGTNQAKLRQPYGCGE